MCIYIYIYTIFGRITLWRVRRASSTHCPSRCWTTGKGASSGVDATSCDVWAAKILQTSFKRYIHTVVNTSDASNCIHLPPPHPKRCLHVASCRFSGARCVPSLTVILSRRPGLQERCTVLVCMFCHCANCVLWVLPWKFRQVPCILPAQSPGHLDSSWLFCFRQKASHEAQTQPLFHGAPKAQRITQPAQNATEAGFLVLAMNMPHQTASPMETLPTCIVQVGTLRVVIFLEVSILHFKARSDDFLDIPGRTMRDVSPSLKSWRAFWSRWLPCLSTHKIS